MGTVFTPEPQKLVGGGPCWWSGLAGDLWVAMDHSSMPDPSETSLSSFLRRVESCQGLALLSVIQISRGYL